MTVGNIGSEFHRDYTVIGNQVNIAARLEQMAKPGEILVSQRTYTKAKDVATFEEASKVHLKGIHSPIAVKVRFRQSKSGIEDLMNDQARERDWEYCREILPKVSRTFALNIAQLEGDIYKTVLLGYLLFRIADTLSLHVHKIKDIPTLMIIVVGKIVYNAKLDHFK